MTNQTRRTRITTVRGVFFWMRDLPWDNPYRPWFLKTLLVINFLGSLYGYYWYHEQLAATPWFWWVFTPDSPLSTTLFALVLALALIGRENNLLRLVAAASVIKYGLWACVVILDYWLQGAKVAPVEAMLFLSHLGMAAEGYLFLRHWSLTFREALLTGGWLLLNDYVDYVLGWHPYLFREDQVALAALTAVLLSGGFILYFLGRKITGEKEY